jgi:hypothetical protein
LDPLRDLVAAAGLLWLLELRPRTLLARAPLAGAIAEALPPGEFVSWTAELGGLDVRSADELVLAAFSDTLLGLARARVSPADIERTFGHRTQVEARAVERGVTRIFGTCGRERCQVALFGSEAVGFERGRLGPLRTAVYFAEGKLRRAEPALRSPPLDALSARLGDAPVRGFAPGPFEGSWGAGLAGLLGAATAAGGTLQPHPAGAVVLRGVLLGAWGAEAGAAADRLAAWFHVLAEDPLGHLLGLDHPVHPALTRADPESVELEVTLDPSALARGLRDLTAASLKEILAP